MQNIIQNITAAVIAGIILATLGFIVHVGIAILTKHSSMQTLKILVVRTIKVIGLSCITGPTLGGLYWVAKGTSAESILPFVQLGVVAVIISFLIHSMKWKQPSSTTNSNTLTRWVHKYADEVIEVNPLKFLFNGREMVCYFDSRADRMRIMSMVISVKNLKGERIRKLFEAHYSSALDSRYAINDNNLYSVFLHPLSSLTENDFCSALYQVENLAKSYGAGDRSSGLEFVGGE